MARTVATIGYEATTVADFLETLLEADVKLVTDIRAVAGSRRPGFAKTRLAANLQEVGIDYVHLRGLGTPPEGRAAARRGDFATLRSVYLEQLDGDTAQADLATLMQLIEGGRPVCMMCFEADPTHCHRSMVADALVARMGVSILHLRPDTSD